MSLGKIARIPSRRTTRAVGVNHDSTLHGSLHRAGFYRALDTCIDALMNEIAEVLSTGIRPLVEEVARLRTETEKPVPLAQAAKEYGVTVRTIHRWISTGRLRAASGHGLRMVFMTTMGAETEASKDLDRLVLKARSK